jgi:8-oxo-dGTP diphosphatase
MLQVVAGVAERAGRVLICRRTAAQSHPLQWEFPGGKVKPDETPQQALAREFEEELGVRGTTSEEIVRYAFAYTGKPAVELIFMRVLRFQGEPANLIFNELRWEPPHALASFDFLEGDRDFLHAFAAGTYNIPS